MYAQGVSRRDFMKVAGVAAGAALWRLVIRWEKADAVWLLP